MECNAELVGASQQEQEQPTAQQQGRSPLFFLLSPLSPRLSNTISVLRVYAMLYCIVLYCITQ